MRTRPRGASRAQGCCGPGRGRPSALDREIFAAGRLSPGNGSVAGSGVRDLMAASVIAVHLIRARLDAWLCLRNGGNGGHFADVWQRLLTCPCSQWFARNRCWRLTSSTAYRRETWPRSPGAAPDAVLARCLVGARRTSSELPPRSGTDAGADRAATGWLPRFSINVAPADRAQGAAVPRIGHEEATRGWPSLPSQGRRLRTAVSRAAPGLSRG